MQCNAMQRLISGPLSADRLLGNDDSCRVSAGVCPFSSVKKTTDSLNISSIQRPRSVPTCCESYLLCRANGDKSLKIPNIRLLVKLGLILAAPSPRKRIVRAQTTCYSFFPRFAQAAMAWIHSIKQSPVTPRLPLHHGKTFSLARRVSLLFYSFCQSLLPTVFLSCRPRSLPASLSFLPLLSLPPPPCK